ncbi:MAG: hypothetical protein LCI00_13520 [Chloroflexi bacterium]|nr:hypothetical protein [Chloroflexota bacterium]MCC6892318.1 hypothetical protein [Anaerolineae bacterium]
MARENQRRIRAASEHPSAGLLADGRGRWVVGVEEAVAVHVVTFADERASAFQCG